MEEVGSGGEMKGQCMRALFILNPISQWPDKVEWKGIWEKDDTACGGEWRGEERGWTWGCSNPGTPGSATNSSRS